MRFEFGTAVLVLAMSGATPAAAQSPSIEDQMRAGFDVCADFASGRIDLATAETTAKRLGFSGGGDGRSMGWPGQGAQARIRLSMSTGGPAWCAVSSSDTGVDGRALSDQAMNWAAERLPGPWRHALQGQPTATDIYEMMGFNGRISVNATQPVRGGARIMLMNRTAIQWGDSRTRIGARPVTLETPAYRPPTLPPAPTGPSTRDTVLTALNQCYAFLGGGERPAWTEGGSGVRMTVTEPSAPRACAIEVTALPVDPELMTAGLQVIDRNRRGISGSREETGFSCIMHRTAVRSRGVEAVAACDRMAPSGQVWLSFQLTSVR
ncbi:MAG: hypothetical protein M3Q74_04030 [Pseudomonadota bacterium]|nr:hypothetical protein [Pseudomonadota bacterium]